VRTTPAFRSCIPGTSPAEATPSSTNRIGAELSGSLYADLHTGLEEYRRRDNRDDVPIELIVRHGIAAELLVRAAQDAQVLMIGRNVPDQDRSVHLGRTARAALYASPCPIVLLTSGTAGRPRRPKVGAGSTAVTS
jgi:hypothetical protein